nr:hypothetical protein [Tanacetum cinerariifolium]
MARLQFCDYHNMVAILEKSEHNIDFHHIVDFVEASPLRIETTEEGTKILATVDGFNEFSSNIATALVCLATNRTYSFSKMIFNGLVKNVNNKGEGSGTPTKPDHTPSPEARHTSHTTHSSPRIPFVTTSPIPPVTSSNTPPIRQYTRRTRIGQSSILPPVADEPASPLRDVSQGKACPTESGFEADQDRATIAKTSTLPYDSEPRVTSPVAAEGKRSGDDVLIKGRNFDEGEAAAERVSDDTEEMAIILTSMDAATVLASGVVDVPTGSGSIPTASPHVPIGSGSIPTASPLAAEVPTGSDVVPTASPVFTTTTVVTPYRKRKGKEIMVESKTPKKKKVARDVEIARIHVKEELQSMIDGLDRSNETVAKYLQEYQQFALELPLERRIELISDLVKYQDNYAKLEDFIPMGSKEEAERLKRKGLSLEQESVKKLKPSDEVPEEVKSPDEVPEEKVKEMMQLVPIGKYHKARRQLSQLPIFVDLLKHRDREELNQLWALVKESLSNRQPTIDKEMEL